VVHGLKVDIEGYPSTNVVSSFSPQCHSWSPYGRTYINNLCDVEWSTESVAGDILNLAQNLVTHGIQQIVICQIPQQESAWWLRAMIL